MGILLARRLITAIACSLALLAQSAAAATYSEAQLRLLYDEASAIGATTYTFYIIGSKTESVIREHEAKLKDPKLQSQSMRSLLNMTPSKSAAYTLQGPIREQLRLLNEGERSHAFRLDQESWVLVELESVNAGTPMPPFARLRDVLPALVAKGALPDPVTLATDHALQQRSLLNKVSSAREFDQLPPGIDPDTVLSNGYTLLQQALLREDTALVNSLLKRRADTNLCPMRTCPLQIAARSAQHAMAFTDQLLEAGAKPDLITVISGEDTALSLASRLGKGDVVERLIAAGADINGGPGNIPPLTLAVHQGHTDVARLLIESGADPLHTKPVTGGTTLTPMNVAISNEKPEMIALLRGNVVKKMGDLKQYKWSGWLEQDGQRLALEQGIIRLKRKPFSIHAMLQSGATLHVHSATGTRIFDEFRSHNLRTPLKPPRRLVAETHDGTARWLLVSDDKAGPADVMRAGGVQAWAWTNWDKDFNRVDKAPQGDVYVRAVSAVALDSGKGEPLPLSLEQSGIHEINVVMGTALSYDNTTAEFVNPIAFKLIFER